MGEHGHPCSLQAAWLMGGFWVLTSSTSQEVGTPLPGSLCATLGPCGRIFVLLGSWSSLLGLSPLCTVEMWWGQGPALPRGHLWLGLIDFFCLSGSLLCCTWSPRASDSPCLWPWRREK